MIKLLETPEETVTKIPYLTGLDCCLSEEDKRNCHTYVTSIMTVTVIFIFVPLVLSLLCVLFRVIFVCCAGIFAWLHNAYAVSDECNAFLVLCDVPYF